ELLECRFERLDAARVVSRERSRAPHEFDRRALLRTRFGQKQRAVRKHERREQHLAAESQLLFRSAPAQASRDHQMNDDEQLLVERQDNALAETAHTTHWLRPDFVNRRRDRAEDEGALQLDTREGMADELLSQRFDVERDVGQFRHARFYVGVSRANSRLKEYRGRLKTYAFPD